MHVVVNADSIDADRDVGAVPRAGDLIRQALSQPEAVVIQI